MGKQKRPLPCDAMLLHGSSTPDPDLRPSKTQKCQLNHFVEQFQLDEEFEERLGKLQGVAQWLMKVAQQRGSNASLMVRSIDSIQHKGQEWVMAIHTVGNQRLNLAFPDQWFKQASQYFQRNGKTFSQQPFVISGLGASIHPSTDKILLSSTNCCVYILDISSVWLDSDNLEWHGWLEVTDGGITEHPVRYTVKRGEDQNLSSSPSDVPYRRALQTMQPTPQHFELSPSPEIKPLPRKSNENNTNKTSKAFHATAQMDMSPEMANEDEQVFAEMHAIDRNISVAPSSICSSQGPEWLQTPKTNRIDTSVSSANENISSSRPILSNSKFQSFLDPSLKSRSPSIAPATGMTKAAMKQAAEERMVGKYRIHPINKIEACSKKLNAFGLVISDEKPFRSSGGTNDYKLSIYLKDLLPLRSNNESVTFNLFASEIEDLPYCKTEDVVAILGFGVKRFDRTVQGTGYKGFQWILLDSKTGKFRFSKHIDKAQTKSLCDEMRAHFDKWNERMEKDSSVTRQTGRSHLKISQVEPDVFFDVTVKVVSVWDGDQPCFYATDYSPHDRLPLVQDHRLNLFAREQLEDAMERSKSNGGGRTMPIYVWDEIKDALNQMKSGDYLTLRNVRPKINQAGFLEGNMGARDSKVNIFSAGEADIAEIEERRTAYEEESALMLAEQAHQNRLQTPGRKESQEDTLSGYDVESPSSNQQQAQRKPHSEREPIYGKTQSIVLDQERSVEKSNTSRSNPAKAKLVLLDEAFVKYPITHLDDVIQLVEPSKVGESEFHRCLVRIRGTPKPERMCHWVTVECQKCKKVLPQNEAFCINCATMVDENLNYSFRLGFLLEDASDQDSLSSASDDNKFQDKRRLGKCCYPVSLANEDASAFFQASAREFRIRQKERNRLAMKLTSLLGQNSMLELMRSGDDDDDDDDVGEGSDSENGRESFEVGIRVTRINNDKMGNSKCKYSIMGCKLA